MLRGKVVRGAMILAAGRLASAVAGVASTLLAARFLLPEDFGLVAIAMAVLTVAGALVELPVASALVQMKSVGKGDYNTAWTLSVLRGAAVAVMMALAAVPVAWAFGDPRLASLISATALYPLLLGFRNAEFETYIRDMDFRWEAIVEVATKLGSFGVTVAVAVLTRSYWALPLGLLASGALALILSFALCPRLPAFSLVGSRKFLGFSVWLGLGAVADSLREASASFLIGRLVGKPTLGAYAIGTQFADRIETLLFAPVERSLFAAFSSLQEDRERLRRAYLQTLNSAMAFALPLCIGLATLADEIVQLLLGPTWAATGRVLAFAAAMVGLYTLGTPGLSLSTALGRTRAVFEVKLVTLLVQAPAMVLATLWYGLDGALWASVAGVVVWSGLSLRLVGAQLGASVALQLRQVGRSALACLAMAAVVLALKAPLAPLAAAGVAERLGVLAMLAAAGALTYAAAHFALWFVSGRPAGVERALLDRLTAR